MKDAALVTVIDFFRGDRDRDRGYNAGWGLLSLLRPCLRKWMLNLKEDIGR